MTKDFIQLHEVYALMSGFSKPWFICGGWAIDLALGHQTREHNDVDIGIFREDQGELRKYLFQWDFFKIIPEDRNIVKWKQEEYLTLPVHETRARKDGKEFEFLLNDSDETQWIFRRNPFVRLPKKDLIKHHNQIPYWAPEVSLLFKAKVMRDHDNQDFENSIESLSVASRAWLRKALEITHPGHPWITRLV